MKIRIVFTGRAYHTTDSLPDEIELAEDATVADAINSVESQLGGDARLPTSCVVAVSGTHVGTIGRFTDRALRDGDELLLVAPVAGG